MRILEVAPPWFPVPPTGYGGIEWIVAALADGLADLGHEVILAASGGSETRAKQLTVYEEPPSLHVGDAWYEAPHALAAYALRDQVDVIHDHTAYIGPTIAAAIWPDGPPVVHTLHGPWTTANEHFYRTIADQVHLVAISHDQASRAPAGIRVAAVCHNGVPLDRYPFHAAKEDFLLYVGRATADKGPEVAVDVAKRAGLPLVMAIKIAEPLELDYHRTMIQPALVDADVDLRRNVGHDEKVGLLGRARAVLVPIRWDEPFGLVMAEAMACGTPAIAYRRGAAPELIVDGVTGMLVEPDDLEAFVDAVHRADRIDPAACRAHVEAELSSDRMVARYVELFERLLAPGS